MSLRSFLGPILAGVIVVFYLFVVLVIPAYVTEVIFTYSESLAWFIVYMATLVAVGYCIKDYGIARSVSRWYEEKFGHKLF